MCTSFLERYVFAPTYVRNFKFPWDHTKSILSWLIATVASICIWPSSIHPKCLKCYASYSITNTGVPAGLSSLNVAHTANETPWDQSGRGHHLNNCTCLAFGAGFGAGLAAGFGMDLGLYSLGQHGHQQYLL